MSRHIVKWRPTIGKNVRNEDRALPFPDLLAASSKWTLLERILAMERKNPISFTDAAVLAQNKYLAARDAGRRGYGPGETNWYSKNFVEWISSLGFHIVLTGDEFELHGVGTPTA